MSAITDMLSVAEYNRQNAILGGAPAQAYTSAVAQKAIEEQQRKQKLEETKTGFAKLQQLLNSESQDYQNKYEIKPTLSPSGDIGYGLKEKSDSDMFSQSVQSGASPMQLRTQFPQFADQIDKLEIAGVFQGGTSIPSAPQGTAIKPMAQGTPIPTQTTGNRQPNLIPKGYDALGRPTGYEIDPMVQKQAESRIKTGEEIGAGSRMAGQSFSNVAGSLQELSRTYADAYREGGIGCKLKEKVAEARLWAGGEQAEGLSATSAFPGQKTEVIARMMPLLTQQGDKPGSVRLVQTVFDKLEKTLPSLNTPPKNARRMMEQSIRNMFRFARASQIMAEKFGVTDQSFESATPQEQQIMSNTLSQMADTVTLSPDEEMGVSEMINAALAPIDELEQGAEGSDTVPQVGQSFNGEKVINVRRIR